MVQRAAKLARKSNYFQKIIHLFGEYPKCFIVCADNVGSQQMQQIRTALRGTAVILMGKNTLMRKAIRGQLTSNSDLEKLLPYIKGNIGLVFTNADLQDVRKLIVDNRTRAPVRAGCRAPVPVIIPAQNTGFGPEKTSFFQALSVPTKIAKGTIEIVNDVSILNKGDKVGASEAALLNMLNISPFTYGLSIEQIYDSGTIISPNILDISAENLIDTFKFAVKNLAAVCFEIGYPTVASIPYSIIDGFKNLLFVAATTAIDFKEATSFMRFAAAALTIPVPIQVKLTEDVKEKKDPVSEAESSDEYMGLGIFD